MNIVHGDAVLHWLSVKLDQPGGWFNPVGIGVMDDRRILVAGAVFESPNPPHNIFGHLYVEHPMYATAILRAGGEYVFHQLGCRRLTLVAESHNLRAVRMHQRLGGVLEGILQGASRTGTDILVFRLTLDDCTVRRLVDGRKIRGLSNPT